MDGHDDSTNKPLYAGDTEAGGGDALYDKKRGGTPKCVRVIVVCIYLFTVSFAALLLSAYYIFFWTPTIDEYDEDSPERLTGCDNND